MSGRHEEFECYECGRLKTRLIWQGRCVTCVVRRLEFNLEENDTLRSENAALKEENERLKARVAELEENNFRLVLIAAAVVIGDKVTEYDREHGITEPDTNCRVYPGNGEDYVYSMIELAKELRMIADKEPANEG